MNEELIKVIEYIGQGECRKCKSALYILESETNSILLSKNGLPVSSNNEYYNIRGYCTNCGEVYDMEKSGLHYRYKSLISFPVKKDNSDLDNTRPDANPFSKENK